MEREQAGELCASRPGEKEQRDGLARDGCETCPDGAEDPDTPNAGPGSPSHAGDGPAPSNDGVDSPVDVDDAHAAAAAAENAGSFGTFWLNRVLPGAIHIEAPAD